MRALGIKWRVFERTRWILIARLADMRQQIGVSGAVVESVGLVQALDRTIRRARRAALRVVDDAPGFEALAARGRIEDAVPIDQYTEALLEHIRMEAVVSGGG